MTGVFGNLFEEVESCCDNANDTASKTSHLQPPPRPRSQCQLSGIDNQGATCYLNSLLQTLLFTPEFRDALYCIGEEELGNLKDLDKAGSKVRVIPIQLQRLFARLLLKDCQSVSTIDLTNSFGWSNDEQFQQQDVQELNRILFNAIESSLVGTSGCDIIRQLYHGKIVNQIRCMMCGKLSEQQEDFFDIPVTVSGSESLEQSLSMAYRETEILQGKNQYKCGGCNKLVDAEKGAKLRSLPSLLTMSLLRFSFDFQKLERYKEIGKFTFPATIDMRPYCDNTQDCHDLDYELFSVLIHSGGAYGGHYHAYIKDIDGLGYWVQPENEPIVVSTAAVTGETDFIECESPIELVQVILMKEKQKSMPIDKLCQDILKQTGLSWNKRFRTKYGPITKFLSKYDDKFLLDQPRNNVSLKNYGICDGKSSPSKVKGACCNCVKEKVSEDKMNAGIPVHNQSCDHCSKHYGKCIQEDKEVQTQSRMASHMPGPGQAWFDFNDSHVHPIYEKAFEKHFSGKESAYMLFYRKKSLVRPKKAHGNKTFCMAESLVAEVMRENSLLKQERSEYELVINQLTLQIHFSECYQYREGALKPKSQMTGWIDIEIDQRASLAQLYRVIMEMRTEYLPCDNFTISKFKELVAGGHIYENLQDSDTVQIQQCNIQNKSKLFVWDGKSVAGELVPCGIDNEPVFLTVIYGDGLQFSQGYVKSLTLQEFMVTLYDIIGIKPDNLNVKRIRGKESVVEVVPFSKAEQHSTLFELNLKDGDQILAEDLSEKGVPLSKADISSTIYCTKFTVQLENKCVDMLASSFHYLSVKVDVDRSITVGELKSIAITKFGVMNVKDGGRLRIDHDKLGLQQPLPQSIVHVVRQNSDENGLSMNVKKTKTMVVCHDETPDVRIQCNLSIAASERKLFIVAVVQVHEDKSLFDAGIMQGSRVVLEPGPAPKYDEITLSFTCESSMTGPDYSEVVINKNCTVGQCLQCILQRANITEGDWHLRKANWCGEAAELLDDLDLILANSPLKDGDLILLKRGRLPPKGFLRLPIWLHSTPDYVKAARKQDGILSWMTNMISNISNRTNTETSWSTGVTSGPQNSFLGNVEVSKEATLLDLKQQILTLNEDLPIPTEDFMRLRLVENNRMTTVLRDKNQILKRLKLTSDSVLAVQVLPEEEQLNKNQLVLEICQRIPDKRQYNAPVELIWDTSGGATVHSLKQALSDMLFIETEHISMAKYFPQKYEWMVIEKGVMTGNQKGKKKSQTKDNIKQAPYYISDGDLIGVKDQRYDPNNIDNFMTDEDEKGKLILQKQIEEKRQMRDRKKGDTEYGPIQKPRRQEVGITIKVGDFS